MDGKYHAAVIFDVDGPLLNLTPEEEDAYFVPFQEVHGLDELSRDWDGYKIRNDIEIYREILSDHLGRPPGDDEIAKLSRRYFDVLREALDSGAAKVEEIPGARQLLERLRAYDGIALGMATANFREAARIRLECVGMWSHLQDFPGAAECGGAKRDVLASVVAALGLAKERVVFLGDNLNDFDAAQACGVHFIGFHVAEQRRARLAAAGAATTAGDHATSLSLIRGFLGLD